MIHHNDDPARHIEGNEIRSKLTSVFQEYGNAEVPEEIKEKVFGTLASIELAANVVDLFTVKFFRTGTEFIFDMATSEKRNEKKRPEM